MITLRRIFLLMLTLLPTAILAGAQTPTVKDVMLDKTGKYIYAQAIYTDADTAKLRARGQLMDKILTFCAGHNLPAPHPDADTFIADATAKGNSAEILSAVCDRTRCFVYITTETLLSRNYALSSGNDKPARQAQPQPKPQAKPAAKPKPAPQPQTQPKPTPTTTPKPAPKPASTPSVKIKPAPANAALPEGRIGEIIADLLEQTSTAGLVSVLEKGKNSMALSRYGSKGTKFIRHCYIVTLVENTLHVYSPQSYEGVRSDYTTGSSVSEPEGTLLFWFLKK